MKEILNQIYATLEDVIPQSGICTALLEIDYTFMLSHIRTAFPNIELIGCTTDGEISSLNGFARDSIVLMVFASDIVEIRAGIGKGTSSNGREVGRDAAFSAISKLKQYQGKERFAVVLTDPHNAGVSDIDKGLKRRSFA